MLNSISNPKNLSLLLITLAVLFIFPAGSAYASWPEQDKLLASDGAIQDLFGESVSISGDYAIVGSSGDDDSGSCSGSAYVFNRSDTSWSEQAKLTASDAAAGDGFGISVSISGDYAVVGALMDDDSGTDSGSAYIFYYNGTTWSEQAKLTASDAAASDGFGISVSINGDYAIIGAYGDDDSGSNSGSAYVFKRSGTSWSEQAKLTAGDGAADDGFGWSVSVSGDYAIVGAYQDDDNGSSSGSAYIFKCDGTNWGEQAKLTASDGAAGDYLGYSVSISGDYAIVGAPGGDDNAINSGSAYPFKRSGTSWSQQVKLGASDGAAGDGFGISVSISGDYAVVGAYYDDDNGNNSGSAYIFKGDILDVRGTKWHDLDEDGRFLEDTDEGEVAMPGWLIYMDVNENGQFDDGEPYDITDVNGSYVLTVAPGTYLVAEENRPCWEQTWPGGEETYSITLVNWQVVEGYDFGNARPSEIHPSGWGQQEQDKLLAADGAASDYFGWSVSVSGDYAIVGAYGDDSYTGSAYIFTANDVNCGKWDQTAKLTARQVAAGDRFGRSVSISGDYAIVGAYLDDDSGSNSGSAYIFYYNGTSWSQQAQLTAADGADGDYFGYSVSISGDYAIVGAYQDDDSGSNSGSAYIFKRDGTSWSEQAKLTVADGAASDYFGYSVSISGAYAIVGAYLDDDNGISCGSAYIFKRDGTSWSQQAKVTASDGAAGDYFGYSVSISGDYAVIGAYGDDDSGSNSGSAYIFKRYSTNWSEQAKLLASDGAASDYFAWSVSISGDYAVVGANYDDDNGASSGSAYIFKRSGASWSEQAKLLASDGAASDWFGVSVSVSGDYAIIGARADDDNGQQSGSAYMFGKVLCPSADLTGNCLVNFKDFAIMAGQWLQGAE